MSTAKFAGLRYPAALAFGLLFTASLYWALWALTAVSFKVEALKSTPIEFTRTRTDTPAETKHRTKPERKLLPVVEELPRIITETGGGEVEGPRYIAPEVFVQGPGLAFDGQGVDREPVPLVRIQPEYPPRAANAGIEGWVKVQFNISATGMVTDAVVVANAPTDIFDAAALKAVSRWRYNPKVDGGVAVERRGVQTLIRFDLEGD